MATVVDDRRSHTPRRRRSEPTGSLIGLTEPMEIRIDDDALALIESKGGVVALDFIPPVG